MYVLVERKDTAFTVDFPHSLHRAFQLRLKTQSGPCIYRSNADHLFHSVCDFSCYSSGLNRLAPEPYRPRAYWMGVRGCKRIFPGGSLTLEWITTIANPADTCLYYRYYICLERRLKSIRFLGACKDTLCSGRW